MKIMKPFILFILFVSILSLSNGYAALPDVSEMIEKTPTAQKPRQIVSSKGLLSPEKSRAIMERLKQSVEPTDILQRFNPTTIVEHHELWTSSSYGATGKRGGSAAESSPQAIMPCRY